MTGSRLFSVLGLIGAVVAGAACASAPSAAPAPPYASAGAPRASTTAPSPRPDPALQRALDDLVRGFRGDVGVYVQHVPSGRTAAVRADELFPTASMIKVPILIGTFDAVERGRFGFGDMLMYRDSLKYSDDDLVGRLRDSTRVPVAKVALLMMTTSDNTASLWLQGLVGGATINRWLSEHGFDSTRVNSRVAGREAARSQYGWGQTTPREMAQLLLMIRNGQAVSRAASEEMYRHLTRVYWTAEALAPLPPWVQAASKQGMVSKARSEVVLVNAPSGDYVFAVTTKNQADSSWTASNEGYVLIRNLSALLWRTFEPQHPWTPAEGAMRFKPPEEP